jgi:preprotein translocase subunit SecD
MKRIISHSIVFVLFTIHAFAGSAHVVEISPITQPALISRGDFKSAEVTGHGNKAVLNLKLKNSAAKKLKAYTEKNVGQELPLMVDGKVVGTPVIRAPITDGVSQVEPLNRGTAEKIDRYINGQE